MRYLVFLATDADHCTLYVTDAWPDLCAIQAMCPQFTTIGVARV